VQAWRQALDEQIGGALRDREVEVGPVGEVPVEGGTADPELGGDLGDPGVRPHALDHCDGRVDELRAAALALAGPACGAPIDSLHDSWHEKGVYC
jgi:hypothetical protein